MRLPPIINKQVYVRRVDPSALAFSLSSFIGFCTHHSFNVTLSFPCPSSHGGYESHCVTVWSSGGVEFVLPIKLKFMTHTHTHTPLFRIPLSLTLSGIINNKILKPSRSPIRLSIINRFYRYLVSNNK